MIMSGWIQIIPKLTPHSNGVEDVHGPSTAPSQVISCQQSKPTKPRRNL